MAVYKTESDAVKALVELKGENFKIYRKKWDQVNQFELETDFPMFLHIETSTNVILNVQCVCREFLNWKKNLDIPKK